MAICDGLRIWDHRPWTWTREFYRLLSSSGFLLVCCILLLLVCYIPPLSFFFSLCILFPDPLLRTLYCILFLTLFSYEFFSLSFFLKDLGCSRGKNMNFWVRLYMNHIRLIFSTIIPPISFYNHTIFEFGSYANHKAYLIN